MVFRVREHYGASYYGPQVERYLRGSRFSRWRLKNVFDLLGDTKNQLLLDLGCGMGTFTVEAVLRGSRAIGIDPALVALEEARRLAVGLGAVDAGFVAADAAGLPFSGESFDGVVCADLTEHLDDETLADALREAARVLRPGGVLAVYTPSPTHLFERLKARSWLINQDPSHIGLRTSARLTSVIGVTGLLVERAYYRPTHLPIYNLIEKLLSRLPWIGGLFRRRICIAARKPST